MARFLRASALLAMGLVASGLLAPVSAGAASAVRVTSTVTTSMTTTMPVLRLSFSAPIRASDLPALTTKPTLATRWQQIGPREVQAVVQGKLTPSTSYAFRVPSTMKCATRCTFTSTHLLSSSVASGAAWEVQLLAQLNYLPVTFTPSSAQSDVSQPVTGTYVWAYPHLPATLSSLWHAGTNNVIIKGAVMAFQSDHNLTTTGIADATTWSDLISAVQADKVNPRPYSYVVVSESSPETATLYVAGKKTFHSLVNTGISVAPTALGTYPVYLRYTSQTMSGTNPDGSHYSDPGIPWISYFNGGDALHGFIRSTYGWPQSLGCVEMPYASAQVIWPHTSIGTLVTVT
jgi:peptidoglycan hydrolase-like protein with peptidoglycan-binding domain